MREMAEMRFQWDRPYYVDARKFSMMSMSMQSASKQLARQRPKSQVPTFTYDIPRRLTPQLVAAVHQSSFRKWVEGG
jgi:hypothetical protein